MRLRLGFLSPRRTLSAAATLALAVAVLAMAVGGRLPFVDGVARAAIAAATGPLVGNDREGQAVLVAAGMSPGETRSGEVTVANTGDGAGSFRLSTHDLVDDPITAGLSRVLDLVVADVTPGATPHTIYAGKVAALNQVDLGGFAPGEFHRYHIAVTFPGGRPATADDRLQGVGTRVTFAWDVVSGDAVPTEGAPLPGVAPGPSSPKSSPAPPVARGPNGVQLAGPTRLLAPAPAVLATVRCPVACRGTVAATIRIAGRRAALRLPGVAFALGAPGAHPVRVRVHAEARRLIAAAVKSGNAVSVRWTLKVAPKAAKRPATGRR